MDHVNIRASIRRGVERGQIGKNLGVEIESAFKSIHFTQRLLSRVIDDPQFISLSEASRERLETAINDCRYSQKYEDALLLVNRLNHLIKAGDSHKPVAFDFETTSAWQKTTGEHGCGWKSNISAAERDCSEFCVNVKTLDPSDHRSSAASSRPSKKMANCDRVRFQF